MFCLFQGRCGGWCPGVGGCVCGVERGLACKVCLLCCVWVGGLGCWFLHLLECGGGCMAGLS